MSDYYNRKGEPVSAEEATQAFLRDEYQDDRRVAETTLPDGRWVSTVFLGINHQFGEGPPLIFETMVFPNENDLSEEYCERYSTEEEAQAGHDRIVRELSE
jgi:hypothetical protein